MKRLVVLAAVLLAMAGCDPTRGMETRTFVLHRLSNEEAIALLTPYVQDGGNLSSKGKWITVRDRPERLKAIQDVLRRYDGDENALDVMLHVQVVEADGFTGRDSAIADIEQTLRQTFRYRGYRLAGEAYIQAREGSTFRRSMGRGAASGQNQGGYQLEGRVDRVTTSQNEQRIPVDIQLRGPTQGGFVDVASTVTATMGKPTVLGQSTGNGAVILVIRPSMAR
jgi:hypothetical protein